MFEHAQSTCSIIFSQSDLSDLTTSPSRFLAQSKWIAGSGDENGLSLDVRPRYVIETSSDVIRDREDLGKEPYRNQARACLPKKQTPKPKHLKSARLG